MTSHSKDTRTDDVAGPRTAAAVGETYQGVASAEVSGHAYHQMTSQRLSVHLVRDRDGLHLIDDNRVVLHSGAPSAREKMPGGPCLVYFRRQGNVDALWTFETSNTRDALAMIGGSDDGWLSNLEVWHPRLLAVVLGCVLGVVCIWRWGIDVLVAAAILLTPPAFVGVLDESNLLAMDKVLAQPTQLSGEDQRSVRAVFEDVVQAAPKAPYGEYTLEFRKIDAFGPNAFALPGGTVVVTDALVNLFAGPNILAGILGHELAHVSERHSLKQLYRSLSSYVLIAMMAGDVGPILEEVLLEGSVIASLSFSRAHESDADHIGLKTSGQAGYDPAALATFFETLAAQGKGGSGITWLSTHPPHEDRIDAIKKIAKDFEDQSAQ